MALASNALTTLEKVKKNLGDTLADLDDELIVQKINEVSEFIESYTKRKFRRKVHTEKYEGTGALFLTLRQFPVIAVNSVMQDEKPVDMSSIDLYEDSGMVYRDCGWPATGKRNITIVYEAGFILPKDETIDTPRTLPYDIEGACIALSTIRYLNRDSENLQERRAGDTTEKFLNDIPHSIKLMLDSYKRVNV